jgi:CubicO group peptidase (beta-lactamase class C family)
VSGLAIAQAHSRGLIDYDAKVATYWPEFARNGKADVTVRQLLSHQAGLAAISRPLSVTDLADPRHRRRRARRPGPELDARGEARLPRDLPRVVRG